MLLAEDQQKSHLKQLRRVRRQKGHFAEWNFETSPQLCFRCQLAQILKEIFFFNFYSVMCLMQILVREFQKHS